MPSAAPVQEPLSGGSLSLDILYSETRHQLERQLDGVDALNTKASLIAGFDLVALAALVQAVEALPKVQRALDKAFVPWFSKAALSAGVLFLAASGLIALWAFCVRNYSGLMHPRRTYDEYFMKPQAESRLALLHNWINAYETNEPVVRKVASCVQASVWTLMASIFVIMTLLCLYLVLM